MPDFPVDWAYEGAIRDFRSRISQLKSLSQRPEFRDLCSPRGSGADFREFQLNLQEVVLWQMGQRQQFRDAGGGKLVLPVQEVQPSMGVILTGRILAAQKRSGTGGVKVKPPWLLAWRFGARAIGARIGGPGSWGLGVLGAKGLGLGSLSGAFLKSALGQSLA